jgi:cytochrome c556
VPAFSTGIRNRRCRLPPHGKVQCDSLRIRGSMVEGLVVRWSNSSAVRRAGFAAAIFAGMFLLRGVGAQDAAPKAPAAELPKIDDVAAQLRVYVERLEESLAKADDYNEAKQSRVEKDAVTAAALAGLLARHDGDHTLKATAAGVQAAANEMAAKYLEHAPAAAALLRIKQLQSGEAKPDAKPAATTDSAKADAPTDAAMLMKQIRFIDNRMKRAARDRSSPEKARGEVAGHAAVIAALAEPLGRAAKPHATMPDEVQEWIEQSNAMAAAAVRLNAAANGDAASDLRVALRAVDATCTRCHADFR